MKYIRTAQLSKLFEEYTESEIFDNLAYLDNDINSGTWGVGFSLFDFIVEYKNALQGYVVRDDEDYLIIAVDREELASLLSCKEIRDEWTGEIYTLSVPEKQK